MSENNIKCPKCEYIRGTTEKTPQYECPKCGIIYSKYNPNTLSNRKRNAPEEENTNNQIPEEPINKNLNSFTQHHPAVIIIACTIAFLAAWAYSTKDDYSEYRMKKEDSQRESTARLGCIEAVSKELKFPLSASFSPINIYARSGAIYAMSGEVKSKNQLGFSVQTKFICEIRVFGSTSDVENLTLIH